MAKPKKGRGKEGMRLDNLREFPYVKHSKAFKKWVKNQLNRFARRYNKNTDE